MVNDDLIWRPFTQMKTAPVPIAINSASGAWLYCGNGDRILDVISSWWVITHGHCHPRITEAISKQSKKLDQVIFAGFSHGPSEQLAQRLVDLMPKPLKHVFFSDNGSTSVEVALKMALQACEQKGCPEKRTFLCFEYSYHGDTTGAMSVGGEGAFTRSYRGLTFKVLRAKQGRFSKDSFNAYVENFEEIIRKEHENIAAVILEPLIQGAGGMIVWPEEAVRRVVQISKDLGVYIIFDEVMTGFGRTGGMFAMDQLGVVPDLVCLSKGITGGMLPLAVTIASRNIYELFLSDDRYRMFFHGHSFTGNPISCAAAVANLEIFEEEETLTRVKKIENIHKERLSSLRPDLPIEDGRVCGSVAAVELTSRTPGYFSELGPHIYRLALEKGILLRPLGNVLYLLPPYCITDEELHRCWDVIGETIEGLGPPVC